MIQTANTNRQPLGPTTLSSQQFDRTRRLALRLAGIQLSDRHRDLLARRSRRFGVRDGAGLDSLLGAAEEGEPKAVRQLLCLLTTKHTGFLRHPRQIDLAARHAVLIARRGGQARLWSAAASTGEEPYSLAMVLIEAFRRDDPPVTILATDLDAEALAVAAEGEFGERALQALTPEQRGQFFNESAVHGRYRIAPAVRRLVKFRELNLAAVTWSVEGFFDVIFCRNVLMYLEDCYRYAVLEHMASLLAPQGLLILDPAEYLGKAAHLFAPGTDGVYPRHSNSRTGVADSKSANHRFKVPSL